MKKTNIYLLTAVVFFSVLLYACSSAAISEQDAKALALQSADISESNVISMKVETSSLDGTDTFVVIFHTADKSYQTIIAKDNGEILRSSYQSKATEEPSSDPQDSSDDSFTLNDAKQAVLKDAGVEASSVKFTKAETEEDDGIIVYEIEFKTDTTYYEYKIGADGTIYEVDQEMFDYRNATGSQITVEEAKKLALAKVKGAGSGDIHIKEEWDDGMHLYTGEIYYDQVKYEFEIDAGTGSFLEWSMDYQD